MLLTNYQVMLRNGIDDQTLINLHKRRWTRLLAPFEWCVGLIHEP